MAYCSLPSFIRHLTVLLITLWPLSPIVAMPSVPRMLLADGYTICAGGSDGYTAQEAIEKSVYHIYFRRPLTPWMKQMGVSKADSRYVFYGLGNIIDRVIAPPVTQEEIDTASAFLDQHHFPWPQSVWQRVIDEKEGHIPIKIEALREGSVAFPGEPVIQITAEEGFGDLAAWFESTLLQVWATSERATLLRYWLQYHKHMVENCLEEGEYPNEAELIAKAQSLMSDMGARSCRTTTDMLDLGLASMLSLNSATPGSVFLANQGETETIGRIAGYSLAHRVVQAYENEAEAYRQLYEFIKAHGYEEGSFVADCYDYRRAVKEYLLPLAKQGLQDGITVFARPDSGDPFEQIIYVLNLAKENGLCRQFRTQDGTELTAMTSLKVIQADGMNFSMVQDINNRLLEKGYSPPHCVVYGVGGSLQHISRDNVSCAQKLAAVGQKDRPVMKIAVPAKESIPGIVKIVRDTEGSASVRTLEEAGESEYVVYYDRRQGEAFSPMSDYRETFSEIQNRVLFEFDQEKPECLLSPGIHQIKTSLRKRYAPQEL